MGEFGLHLLVTWFEKMGTGKKNLTRYQPVGWPSIFPPTNLSALESTTRTLGAIVIVCDEVLIREKIQNDYRESSKQQDTKYSSDQARTFIARPLLGAVVMDYQARWECMLPHQ